MDIEDDSLVERQRMILHMTQQTAEELIIDCAVHLALVNGQTVPYVLAGCMAGIPWSKSEWDEIADNFREELGIECA